MGHKVITGIAAVAATVLAAGPASAEIRVQQGIAGVRLGMTEGKVRAALGRPGAITLTSSTVRLKNLIYASGTTVSIFRSTGRVVNIDTIDRRQRTASGVGVGSKKVEIRAGIRQVNCPVAEPKICRVGVLEAGRVSTDFLFRKGKVWRVNIGVLLD
jgi:hypothetical protein